MELRINRIQINHTQPVIRKNYFLTKKTSCIEAYTDKLGMVNSNMSFVILETLKCFNYLIFLREYRQDIQIFLLDKYFVQLSNMLLSEALKLVKAYLRLGHDLKKFQNN